MGNICSRSSNEADPFNQPGRVVGTNPGGTAAPRAPLPAKTNWKATPGRTLGESTTGSSTAGTDEARANAAIAAQKRAEGALANKGKLGSKLAAQKAQTQAQTLDQVSRTERAARDVDGAEAARRWE
ncbi:hypothetical protein DTO013E5_9267 [Penicillium roqueforti]|uniref:Uncharacterized protein n=1 Tax=Penicillium roqueforti (strain FM164) TaxID=1365484 RepID=W6Q2T4_PENRF|nr:uncharacterized protein LCP9604111_4844 [Penicillium roqueforti]XP_057043831.1 uncharacterized protein N7518_001453 [Penicillium psychrosexuale]CDM30286.1 hypothetical protein PROQFM164_S02g000435 [Penicillium roqueforti FM164]KAF9249128.1 hypothetical protein LCP9604111_4844 [Penicillium roqueforti]KAI1832049.1 hypothetical protein CBS147337_7121 [Penicillium roqueforti]KAI2673330.1 hypothetical protein CBS147355_7629 [Penicillium roqueforti]KAI2677426.1 hypothetical protein LCP963914a_80